MTTLRWRLFRSNHCGALDTLHEGFKRRDHGAAVSSDREDFPETFKTDVAGVNVHVLGPSAIRDHPGPGSRRG